MSNIGKSLLWAGAILGVAWISKVQGLEGAEASVLIAGLVAAGTASLKADKGCGGCKRVPLF